MPLYTIETTYRLPHFRQRTFEASTPEAACRLALEDEDWDGDRVDYETVGETYVTGVWMSPAANSGPAICVPDCFDEAVQRKAGMFGELLALLQERARPPDLSRDEFEDWLPRALAAIARADAVLSAQRGEMQ